VNYSYPARFRRVVRPALFDISLSANEGETVGVVGESGSGKSTLARVIMGLLRPTTGRMTIEGTDVASLGGARMQAFRRNMQMVFQDPYDALNPRRTVEQTVADPLHLLKLSRAERD